MILDAMAIITFSLPQEAYDKLSKAALDGESENLAAKRIVLEALGLEKPISYSVNLEDRIKTLEDKILAPDQILPDWEERLGEIESAISNLYTALGDHKKQTASSLETIKKVISLQPPKSIEIERNIPNNRGYTINDTIQELREIIGSNAMTEVHGGKKRTKKEVAEYLALHDYPGPKKPWRWNVRSLNQALNDWPLVWK